MSLSATLARFVDMLDDVPDFPFQADLRAVKTALDEHFPMSPEEAGRLLRTLVDGARDMPGFIFGDDLAEAERVLIRYNF
jgi:hypothetical protein